MRVIDTVVEDESGKPLSGLQVRAFDKDILFDDKLGTAVTDAAGNFSGSTTAPSTSATGSSPRPRLYIRVFDASGKKLLFSSQKAIRKEPQVEERFDVRIPRTKIG